MSDLFGNISGLHTAYSNKHQHYPAIQIKDSAQILDQAVRLLLPDFVSDGPSQVDVSPIAINQNQELIFKATDSDKFKS